jgi:TP901 family phage tail tape measure protein
VGKISGINPIAGAATAGLMAIVGGAVAVGVASTRMAGDYEQSMIKMQALAGVSAEDAKQASAAILQMASVVGQSPKTLAEGLYYIASAGYSAKDSLILLGLSAKAAAIGNTTTEITANALTAAMKAFNVPASQANQIMDIMVRTVSTGKTEFQDYATVIGKISINAKQAGVTFKEANAAFATLTNVMPSSKQAADSLNALLQTSSRFSVLEARAKGLHLQFDLTAYKSMNLEQRLQYLKQITGGNTEEMSKLLGRQNAMAAATILGTDHFKGYNDALSNIGHSAGATDIAFQKTQQGFNQSTARVKASFDVLLITIGQQLLPTLTKIAQALVPVIMAFADWLNKSGALKNGISFVIGAITTLVNVGSAIVSFFQHNEAAMTALKIVLIAVAGAILASMVVAFYAWAVAAGAAAIATLAATWPILLIGALIALVVAGIILAVMHWGEIAHWLQGIWGAVVGWLRGLWSGFSSWFMGALGAIGNFFHSVWNGIVHGLQAAWNAIVTVVRIGALLLLAAVFAPIIAIVALFLWLYNHNYYFKALIDTIVNVVKAGLAWLTNAWHTAIAWIVAKWEYIKAMAEIYWTALQFLIQQKINEAKSVIMSVWNSVMSFLSGIWSNISSKARQLWDTIVGFFQSAWGRISGPLNSIGSNIAGFFGNLASTALDWGKNLIQGFINGIQGMLGAVGNAAKNVVATIGKFLGFHSPAEEGPGQHLLEWPRNMVKSYADEMVGQKPYLEKAVAMTIAPIAMMQYAVPLTRPTSSLMNGGGATHNYNITVNAPARTQDEADEIADTVARKLGTMLQSQSTLTGGLH